jgi:methylmalonyl-CoA/ethylmalonyl-CoA epimerase
MCEYIKGLNAHAARPERISHVGIAVKDLEGAISDFGLVFDVSSGVERVEVEGEQVRAAFIRVGDAEIELLSPLSADGGGPISRFLASRGEGLHHIAIKVADVSEAMEEARRNGLDVLDPKPRRGARGSEAAFVHPKSMHGVLIEFYNR